MITIDQGSKRFGSIQALDGLSLQVEEGRITGLLGLNGSGKSTTLKVIAGLLHLDQGEIRIDGEPPSISSKQKIAYLPEIDVLYPWMTVSDAVTYMKDFYADWDDQKAARLVEYFQLSPARKIRDLSKGSRAKVKLLLALSRRAKYLLLDEPLSGIDVLAREDLIQALVDDFLEEGQSILITTHEVKEVEPILDDVLFIRAGKIALQGNLEQLKAAKNLSLVEIMKEVFGGVHHV
ncbi:ABC transporter ATP-binding protein [Effusibacillus dendaii]|uniref:ABC transporter n=1 Tax=Effusibacillus dendaii TaxID=2743772 RepID=A0A7I8DBK7_9BACL|nr:ABC transporter ATP-binding protein [Effusibacillus dendaii]BCJ87573.1 ABC transporter [Effusibacillus dendaii]